MGGDASAGWRSQWNSISLDDTSGLPTGFAPTRRRNQRRSRTSLIGRLCWKSNWVATNARVIASGRAILVQTGWNSPSLARVRSFVPRRRGLTSMRRSMSRSVDCSNGCAVRRIAARCTVGAGAVPHRYARLPRAGCRCGVGEVAGGGLPDVAFLPAARDVLDPRVRNVTVGSAASRSEPLPGAEVGAEHRDDQDSELEYSPVVIREKVFAAEAMSVDEALYFMELVGHDFYLFRDSESGRASVVYRRKGWNYGLIGLDEHGGPDAPRSGTD